MSTMDSRAFSVMSAKKRELLRRMLEKEGLHAPDRIPRANDRASGPLSYAQQRLWFIDRFEPGNTAYNMPVAVRLRGALDVISLERALAEVVRRHEVLRTRFVIGDLDPIAFLNASGPLTALPIVDLTGLEGEQGRHAMQERLEHEAAKPFDLAEGNLLRCRLLQLAPKEAVLLLTMHHIASDGWSMGILVHEIVALYEAFTAGLPSPLQDLEIQYVDYARWQRDSLSRGKLDQQLEFWRRALHQVPKLALPTDYLRPAVASRGGARIVYEISSTTLKALRSLAQEEDASLFMVVITTFYVVLSKWAGQQDIAIGTPVGNRPQTQVESLIGLFLNTLVLRIHPEEDLTVRHLIRHVREVSLSAFANQELPFERLVQDLNPERSLNRTSLFQVLFNMQSAPAPELKAGNLLLEVLPGKGEAEEFDLDLAVEEGQHGLVCILSYATDLFAADTMERFAQHLRHAAAAFAADPSQSVSALNLLDEEELYCVTTGWNRSAQAYPQNETLHSAISKVANLHPHLNAVVAQDEHLTYSDLESRSNSLAHYLLSLQFPAESLIGLCTDRSAWTIVGILAILKAGCAYVPLDPTYPQARLTHMLHDANVPIVLTQTSVAAALPPGTTRVLVIDDSWPEISKCPDSPPPCVTSASNLAYVIYTSGSTGNPKRVGVTHKSVQNLLADFNRRAPVQPRHACSLWTSFSFDVSVYECFSALLSGGALHIVPENARYSPEQFCEWLIGHDIASAYVPPFLLSSLEAHSSHGPLPLRRLLVGVEPIPEAQLRRIRSACPELTIINGYGPTEATVCSTLYSLPSVPSSARLGLTPIGSPVANSQSYVVDASFQPVPIGVPGELLIGGDGLARGYLGQASLTAERFLPDPYATQPGSRVYRTGDVVRWRADGNIEFLGRADNQVKLNGYRIEMAEIEAALTAHTEVEQAAVAIQLDDKGVRRLVAYVVWSDFSIGSVALRSYLLQKLPPYMVPWAYVELDALPLTPNGKLDRARLPRPEQGAERPYTEPGSPDEEILQAIWSEVLGVERVGVEANFFDIGGHSLLATQVVSRLKQTFSLDLPLRTLFEKPTIRELATELAALRHAAQPDPLPPLTRAPALAALPLSYAQQRLWFLAQLGEEAAAYNISLQLRLTGPLHAEALERALQELVRRHEVLRTRFLIPAIPTPGFPPGSAVQQVEEMDTWKQRPGSWSRLDFSHLPPGQQQDELARLAHQQAALRFDLAEGGLFRTTLAQIGAQEHLLHLTMHHIVSDGWSMSVLVRELAGLYQAFSAGRLSPLAKLPIQYGDYALWQRSWMEAGLLEPQLAFWSRQLAGLTPLEMPVDHPRARMRSWRAGKVTLSLGQELTGQLRLISRQAGATLFMTLLAGLQALLSRYTGQKDIAVGSPIANRTRAELEGLIGFFVNTLVLRGDLHDDPTLTDLLQRTRNTTLEAYAHQDAPFERIVEMLDPERDMTRQPLVQVMLVLENNPEPDLRLQDLVLTAESSAEPGDAKFDLTLGLVDTEDGLQGEIEYAAELYDPETIENFARRYESVLQQLATQPTLHLSELTLLTPGQRQHLLYDKNQTQRPLPDQTISQRFEQQARSRPHHPAIVFDDQTLTYEQLNTQANQLAHYLLDRGAAPETRIAICLERSPNLIIALLATLKTGAAYVPIDPTYPQNRIEYMLRDSAPSLLLTSSSHEAMFQAYRSKTVLLDRIDESLARESPADPCLAPSPDTAAYVIYTSGSTGQPKGVVVPQRGVIRLVCNTDYLEAGSCERVAHLSNVSFDAATFEIWAALLNGGELVILSHHVVLEPVLLGAALCRRPISAMFLTGALFNQIVDLAPEALATVGTLLVGGEAIDPVRAQRLLASYPPQRFLNGYGPTEATTFAVWHLITDEDTSATVPIGLPIANTEVYVLDEWLNPVPPGVTGELYLGGAGLARGYLGQPSFTADRFVPNPYAISAGQRIYRTGDLTRWNLKGQLEFLGRADQQVKIRGHRIELGEIENTLQSNPAVRQVVVVAREDSRRDKELVAYVVWSDFSIGSVALRSYLLQKLPPYMVPWAYVELDALPLTPNGKLDRARLPRPEQGAERPYTEPGSPDEEILQAIWSEVLGVERVGVEANFFDIGGHSLLATQVVSRLKQTFSLDLPLRTLFEKPTIRELATELAALRHAAQPDPLPPLTRAPALAALPLSYAQQRLWFLAQLGEEAAAYNISLQLRLTGPLHAEALERALQELVRRHEVLRTRFLIPAIPTPGFPPGSAVQQVEEMDTWKQRPGSWSRLDFSHLPPGQQQDELARLAHQQAALRFDLAEGGLFRTTLAQIGAQEHLLHLTMHHIVSDGWSMSVLVRELAGLYQAFSAGRLSPLAKLPIQYGDYALWQRSWMEAGLLEPQLAFWSRQLAGLTPLEMPVDHPRARMRSWRAGKVTLSLGQELTGQLRLISRQAGATLFMTLLAGLQALLSRYTGQKDIAVGSPIANRTRAELEGLIGFFVNTLVLRGDLHDDPTLTDLLQRTRNTTLEAYAHQDAPFERIVEMLDPERDMTRQPLVQVMLVLENNPEPDLRLQDLVLTAESSAEPGDAKFDLTLGLVDTEDGLQGEIEYAAELYDPETIENFARRYESVLQQLATQPTLHLSELTLLTPGQRQHLLYDKNQTQRPLPDQTISQRFEQQARSRPHHPAIVFDDQTLTYEQLNTQANQLAHYLLDRGAAPETRIAICLERSPNLIIALLATLKTGAAYVPIDPTYPQNRIEYMLRDSAPSLLLTSSSHEAMFQAYRSKTVLLDRIDESLARESPGDPCLALSPDTAAYVIYTSGSTGQPKGVVVPQRGVIRLVCNTDYLEAGSCERVAHLSNVSFDAATFEIWAALLNGGELVILSHHVVLEPVLLGAALRRRPISAMVLTGALFNQIVDLAPEALATVGTLLVGGEAIDPVRAQRLLASYPPQRFLNGYGPTEATTFAVWHLITDEDTSATVPIGLPIANTEVYVLDEWLNPVPPGVTGELYLGGAGLARGYLGQPSFTADRFVPNPYAISAGQRIYRTGDLTRWNLKGQLEFLGRADQQVKIRGHRIELGEIETVLCSHPTISDAVILLNALPSGEKTLLACVIAQSEACSPDDLRSFLTLKLPAYMVPPRIVLLTSFPFTPNGKLDRKSLALKAEAIIGSQQETDHPADELEECVAAIWHEVLSTPRVGIHVNFFLAGGHSLLAVRLIARISQEFHRDIPLRVVFDHPTIAAQAAYLRIQPERSTHPSLVPLRTSGSRPPLFCVHPYFGLAHCYLSLASELGPEQPFYGFQSQGIGPDELPLTTIPDMAAAYLRELRVVQPEGPYSIAGWSMGALIAYEMAQQLSADGEQTIYLALLEGYAQHDLSTSNPGLDEDDYILHSLMREFEFPQDEMRSLSPIQRRMHYLESAKAAGAVPEDVSPKQFDRMIRVIRANLTAIANYRPDPYQGSATLIRIPCISGQDPTNGWQALVHGHLNVFEVEGTHNEFMNEPSVTQIASILTRQLAAFEASDELLQPAIGAYGGI